MTAPEHRAAVTFLRRAGLFGAVLALIAGIFGMHVMTTNHMPAMAAAAGSAHHESSDAGHVEHLAATPNLDMSGFQPGSDPGAAQCSASGSCTSVHAMTGACTPSAKIGSLQAPMPGTWVIARAPLTGATTETPANWSYLPGSPSPGELCISRT